MSKTDQAEELYDAIRATVAARYGDSNDHELHVLNEALDVALNMLYAAGLADPEMIAAIDATDPEDFA